MRMRSDGWACVARNGRSAANGLPFCLLTAECAVVARVARRCDNRVSHPLIFIRFAAYLYYSFRRDLCRRI